MVEEGSGYCFGIGIGIGINIGIGDGILMVDGAKGSVGGPLRCSLDSLVVEERGHHNWGLHL